MFRKTWKYWEIPVRQIGGLENIIKEQDEKFLRIESIHLINESWHVIGYYLS